ncbi:hypothetical protein CUMW_061040 [Citrus unshiu]|uniref:Uncharacterized protein n=1 Tax=Citrus unshiu TaxID=55188 RepID=A0A2H5NN81_CITUN|nr:hypothetical protein CUMW_061040 [Citrus unshiu]
MISTSSNTLFIVDRHFIVFAV